MRLGFKALGGVGLLAILAIAASTHARDSEARDPDSRTRALSDKLGQPAFFQFDEETPLADVLWYIGELTRGPEFPRGAPIYVDAIAMKEAGVTTGTKITYSEHEKPLRESLGLILRRLHPDLDFAIRDGALYIEGPTSQARRDGEAR